MAQAVGVSLMTVSRALRQPERLSEATRAQVLETVQRLGYEPNNIAANLASNRSTVVGQIVPGIQSSLYAETIKGTSDQTEQRSQQLVVAALAAAQPQPGDSFA